MAAPDGGVVVAGSTEVSGQNNNTWLRKYDGEGTEVWTRTSTSDGAVGDSFRAVDVGADGNVAAAGSEGTDLVVRLLSPGGVELWTHSYDGAAVDSGAFSDAAYAVVIDSSGAVIVAGGGLVGPTDFDAWVRKYDADGDLLWTADPESTMEDAELGNGIAVDSHDYVLVAGSNSAGGWLVKYTP